MKLLAHIAEVEGKRLEQSLMEHSINTAEYASGCLKSIGFYRTAYLSGLMHDAGKATMLFVDYLECSFAGNDVGKGSVVHSFTGVIYMMENYHDKTTDKWKRLTCEVIAYAIGAHHGLFDCVDLDGKNGFLHRLKKDKSAICYDEAMENFFAQVVSKEKIDGYFEAAVQEVQSFFKRTQESYRSGEKVFFQISMLIRLITASVIYGDRRDTGEFMSQSAGEVEQEICWYNQREFFEHKVQQFSADTELNRVRAEISDQCLKFAEKPAGIYRLNIPTGAGKTLCSLRYALAHAEKYHKKRIIFIIPLLSVLEQNAEVIREYVLDKNLVQEHHSNIIHEKAEISYGGDKAQEELKRYELATEKWNAPIIISTVVQFLDGLFHAKTSAVERMQSLCDSVIVIDEVQSLPKKVTAMFNMALNFLQRFCNATIVLSSATQPCFEEVKWPIQLAEKPDMVLLSERQRTVFKRCGIVDCTDPYGMDIDKCAGFCGKLMKCHSSLLAICNTKSEARELYEKMKKQAEDLDCDVIHLSTAMCQEHRLDVLAELLKKLAVLQERLRLEKPARKLVCVSTCLVEAGIDFSFEGVVRIRAGIDNLAQAAGRCNRSYEYVGGGKVYLVNLQKENLSMLKEIRVAQDCTQKVQEYVKQLGEESLIGELATRRFYQYLFESTKEEVDYPIVHDKRKYYLAKLLANCNDKLDRQENKGFILGQPFATVGKLFKVFDEDAIDVLVPYKEGVRLIEKLRTLDNMAFNLSELKAIVRQAKPYTVSLFQWQKDMLDDAGLLHRLCDGKILALDQKAYSMECGVLDVREQPVENFMF